jgi:hypothetical protein
VFYLNCEAIWDGGLFELFGLTAKTGKLHQSGLMTFPIENLTGIFSLRDSA